MLKRERIVHLVLITNLSAVERLCAAVDTFVAVEYAVIEEMIPAWFGKTAYLKSPKSRLNFEF
jgi:hypothetical protein